MAFEIASAFVRIRPNMTGFKGETESGVKSAFSGLAKVAGVALGAGAAFEFGKSIISDAASVQKSAETINAEFGKAGQQIHKFADTAGLQLGIASHATEETGARFGILFKNLGIGQKQGAAMTVGLLKLAGSLSAIRGVDPSTVLARLPLALAGNLRSLKQLGIAVDASQIKIAAFKLGLISSVKDGITPAIKAQAIYSLATANLPQFLDQARKHSGDLINVQRRLSAEFDHAKETLGKALLPTFAKLATELTKWFERMQKSGRLQKVFNEIARDTVKVVHFLVAAFKFLYDITAPVVKAVGGVKDAFILLFSVLAVNKIRQIASSIVSNLVNNGLDKMKKSSIEARQQYVADTGVMKVASIGLGATIKSALVTSGIGLLVIAVGFAVQYVITHWDTVKRATVALAEGIAATWNGLKTTLAGIASIIGGSLVAALTAPLVGLAQVASKAFGWVPFVGGKIKDAAKAVTGFSEAAGIDLVKSGTAAVAKGAGEMAHGFSDAWAKAMRKEGNNTNTKGGLRATGIQFGKAVSDAAAAAAATGASGVTNAVSKAMATAIAAAHKRIEDSIISAKKNLDTIIGHLADTIAKIQQKLGGAAGALAGTPQAQAFQKLKDLISSGAPSFAIARANQELSSQLQNVGKSQAQTVKDQLVKLKDAYLHQTITASQFQSRFNKLLIQQGATAKNAAKALGISGADVFKAQVKAVHEQVSAIAAVPAKLRGIGGTGADATIKIVRPLEVIRAQDARLASQASRERARIAKASEKTAALLATMKATHVGPLPGHDKTPPGHASERAKKAAHAGVQP